MSIRERSIGADDIEAARFAALIRKLNGVTEIVGVDGRGCVGLLG